MMNAGFFLGILAALATIFYSFGDGAAVKTSMLICSAGNRFPTPGDSFTFINNCPYTIWPGTLTSGGGAQLSLTGFELTSETSSSLDVSAPWTGRFWARTLCATSSSGKFNCQTGDCASSQLDCNGAGAIPPATLVEFALAANNGQDFYDISIVDGFNLPVSITLQGGSGGCNTISCPVDINANCPEELALKNSDGATIGCQSACQVFNQPRYCCTGAFASPETCQPTNYSNYFKRNCPLAYSYPLDEQIGTAFSCNGGPKYAITFCP